MLIPSQVLSFIQISPLIDSISVQEIGFENDWMTSIISYMKDGVLPDGKEAVRKLKVQVARLVLIKDVLYKRGFSCPHHSKSRSLVHKLIRAGYY